MRLNSEMVIYLKQLIQEIIPGSTVYLFGSRVNDQGRGGDIDLMILTAQPAEKRLFRKVRTEFYKKYGWRKIDLVNFTYTDESSFHKLIINDCMLL